MTPALNEKTYKTVLGKTDFNNNTPVGKIVHKYFDALASVLPDTTQRFKAAIGQAADRTVDDRACERAST